MMKLAGCLAAAVAAATLISGCTSSYVQSLTVTRIPRSASGLYPVEAQWETDQKSVRESSLKGWVVVGDQLYPMHRVENATNRWEGVVPVPADRNYVYYHFKFDYDYDAFAKNPRPSSIRSESYQLLIKD